MNLLLLRAKNHEKQGQDIMKQYCYVVRYGWNEFRLFLEKMALSMVWSYLRHTPASSMESIRPLGLWRTEVRDRYALQLMCCLYHRTALD